ncbi:40-residue YVTN family beta-propeller repeat-containing protein [Altererythrobacter xiamenensis]|uniref:40-residue YVTN family beta-propeller repeat-containing protein n=1 Tax=Altererythrobacter xiamenensis TaxID=1316679 RepID=A0A1Y6E4W8_9SPHN|nr:YncE family protein [Altererythrobacter xiamenensis]SMQ57699.1 40-residue YVTN family beta-propeller repeat-containing protein [Altererythrobacter xiamenensis]
MVMSMQVRFVGSIAALALGAAACAPVAGEGAASQRSAEGDGAGALFVAGKFGNTLARIDLASGAETARVDSCANPHELATSPDDTHVALACYGGTSVDIFRAEDLAKVKSIDLGDNARPHGIQWHANGDLYATAEGRQSVFWIRDPLGSAETFEYSTAKQGSHMLVVAPNGNHAWTTDLGSKTVTLVDLKTRRAPRSVEVGIEPEGIALSPDGKALWVSARGSNAAFELDPQTLEIRKTVATGAFPLRIAIRPQGDVAVTSDLQDGGMSVIDLASGEVLRSIAVSSPDEAEQRFQVTVLWSPDGERIYVAETRSNTIAEVDYDSGEVLRRLPGEGGGDGMAIFD